MYRYYSIINYDVGKFYLSTETKLQPLIAFCKTIQINNEF